MKSSERLIYITQVLDETGFLSVADLSKRLAVSEMTIRRDLDKLAKEKCIHRVFGGAVPARNGMNLKEEAAHQPLKESKDKFPETPTPIIRTTQLEFCQSEVLIVTSLDPKYELLVNDSLYNQKIPVIAEALPHMNAETYISIDDFTAGVELGKWAGNYAIEKWGGRANILDLSYHLDNTKARSRGFLTGVREVIPDIEDPLSLNTQSQYGLAYQLTKDALSINHNLNIIFAINDTNAWGAVQACKDLKISADQLIVITFGLEGDTLKNALNQEMYCKAGLAMFPEIVGRVCVESAIFIFNKKPLPEHLVTPFAILTKDTLPDFYTCIEGNWRLRWDVVEERLELPMQINGLKSPAEINLPTCIGVVTPFYEHEWYQSLTAAMYQYASQYGVGLELIDPEQSLRDGIETRRHEIAHLAVDYIKPNEGIFIGSGVISLLMAELLKGKNDITVITNSEVVLDTLKNSPGITLISTGGVLRRNSMIFVGPTAENSLRDLRLDKLFLEVSGISFSFGLSHANVSEVTVKQTMINSAREVVLIADHSLVGQESLIQIAPLTKVHTLITDDGLPASYRLRFIQLGIQVIIPKP
jgi:DeoR/GlpR family transcriptional regulator of sugar metabolism/ABC-type sugar transport system substrate-binding protein